ncbi:MAG: DegT/DnrJ/EryC1/StrS family aminotransferase [Candidatus Bathyarchaeota archaeon]|nr:DegT/DnrJ/EryC1/StrS family aminotransferase [Candidatus Bathyarchaeota archaeon]
MKRIPVAKPEIGKEELKNVIAAVKSGWISSKGPFIEEFEKGFSSYIGMKYGIATSNGTTALHLALSSLDIKKGDKVIVPSLTFVAVANAVAFTGAEPVFVDSNPKYWCIDPSRIEKTIDKKVKAIIAVHLYGHPCEMDELLKITKDYGIYIIEDCAEAHGAEYKGRKVGSFGVISCFSFYGNKIITTGEGGMCLTNDRELSEKMRLLRDHGMNRNKRYWHDIRGFNYRMTNVQAAIGVAQLKKIDRIIGRKREIAKNYSELFRNVPSITPQPEMDWARNVYWLYSILAPNKTVRDDLIRYLDSKNVETRPFFYPIHILPPYRRQVRLPVSEKLSSTGVNLPSGPQISKEEIQHVVESVKDFVKRNKS